MVAKTEKTQIKNSMILQLSFLLQNLKAAEYSIIMHSAALFYSTGDKIPPTGYTL
ncbi:MAG: hypothetical protein FWD03_03185 [Defluviitaleaceae bacterium]|nr:hypothetical protein [Defluviitaleaceae bacterium]